MVDFEGLSVLDLFAGTGSISLEFLSRGCARVVSVEKDSRHFAFIRSIMTKLQDKASVILRMDAFRYIQRSSEHFDLIFADPPYALPELPEIPDRIFSASLLKDGDLFILEHGKNLDFSSHPHFVEHRSYGSVNFSFFRK